MQRTANIIQGKLLLTKSEPNSSIFKENLLTKQLRLTGNWRLSTAKAAKNEYKMQVFEEFETKIY